MDCVLFDLDGVLVLSEPAHADAYRRLFAPFGIDFGPAEYREVGLGRPRAVVIREVLGDLGDEDFARLMAAKARYTEDYIRTHGLPEVPGAAAFVYSLTVPSGVVTASRTPHFFLPAIGLADAFEVVVDATMVDHQKPHPEPYLKATAALGCDPAKAVVIEDSPSGIAAGKAAGATVIGLTTTRSATELAEADVVVDDYEGVRRVFDDL